MSAVDFAEMMDVEYSVDEYFEPEELAKMSPIEKRRYKNLRANYEVMKAMGEHLSKLLYLLIWDRRQRRYSSAET